MNPPSDLHERLKNLEQTQSAGCPVSRFIATLDEDTAALLSRLLADKSVSTRQIHRELRGTRRPDRHGIAEHRNQECLCYASV